MKRIFRHRVHTFPTLYTFYSNIFLRSISYSSTGISGQKRKKGEMEYIATSYKPTLSYKYLQKYICVSTNFIWEWGWRVCTVEHIPILGQGTTNTYLELAAVVISMHAFYLKLLGDDLSLHIFHSFNFKGVMMFAFRAGTILNLTILSTKK